MTMEELIRHPSMQREFSRFHSLGGQIIVKTNKIVLDAANVIPISIAEIFKQRIKKCDKAGLIEIQIQNGA